MTDLVLTPDAEQLVSGFLRADADVVALLGDHVYTVLPVHEKLKLPFARITLVGGPATPILRPRWLVACRLQFDVWAQPKKAARTAAETIAAVLAGRLVGAHDLGAVTAVDVDQPSYLPDSDLSDPATPRYMLQAVVTVHP